MASDTLFRNVDCDAAGEWPLDYTWRDKANSADLPRSFDEWQRIRLWLVEHDAVGNVEGLLRKYWRFTVICEEDKLWVELAHIDHPHGVVDVGFERVGIESRDVTGEGKARRTIAT